MSVNGGVLVNINIAIDGPSGAGKSTISRSLAKRLGYIYVDTGALYRAVALGCMRAGADMDSEDSVSGCLHGLAVELVYREGEQLVTLDGRDVSRDIRAPEISQWASKLSAMPAVRAFLLEKQRGIARAGNVIMDGRDIGTVILPNAQIKIFLTAEPEDRARRRYEELIAKGVSCDYETVLREIQERDYRDGTRKFSPTRMAGDAELIDTTGNTLEQSIEILYGYVVETLGSFE
jgi:cytidylate kinase